MDSHQLIKRSHLAVRTKKLEHKFLANTPRQANLPVQCVAPIPRPSLPGPCLAWVDEWVGLTFLCILSCPESALLSLSGALSEMPAPEGGERSAAFHPPF